MCGSIASRKNTKTEPDSMTLARLRSSMIVLYHQKDRLWLVIWLGGMILLWLWNLVFLNRPALAHLEAAFVNTLAGGLSVVFFSLVLGWSIGVSLYFLEQARGRVFYLMLTFVLNVVRSIPQIVGILTGYLFLTFFIEREILLNPYSQILFMAFVISLVVFQELVDLVRERIEYHKRLDFFHAMLCCGIKESRIVNIEILWKNSRSHMLHKLISIFGIAVFLQCSIDFIISVGLSTDVSLSNFPATLGSLLAKMDSKQDILAIGTVLSDIRFMGDLFVEHLQGISIAIIIVFTLLCVYKVSNGFVKRLNL